MLACEIMVGISSLVTDFSEESVGNIYFFYSVIYSGMSTGLFVLMYGM